jgi:hypothetical protein
VVAELPLSEVSRVALTDADRDGVLDLVLGSGLNLMVAKGRNDPYARFGDVKNVVIDIAADDRAAHGAFIGVAGTSAGVQAIVASAGRLIASVDLSCALQ